MSLHALLHLMDGHASGAFSDHELSRRLHSLDGKGVLPAPNDAYRNDAAVDVVPEHASAQRAGERTHAHPHTYTRRRTHAAH